MGDRARRWSAVAVPVAFLALFFAWPVLAIVLRGLAEDGSVVDVWRRRSTGDVLWFTAGQAALSTLVTLAIGLPAAWATARTALPGRRVVRVLVLVPFVLPTLVVGAAVEALFERFGARTGSLTAIVVAHVVFNVAVVVRIVGGHWSLLDPRVEEVARVLGASPWRVVREVTLPRLAPALWSAAAIVFLFCFTSFGVILTVGGPGLPTLETEIWRHATRRTDFGTAAALALLQMAAVVVLLVVGGRLERRLASGATSRRVARPRPLRTGRERAVVVAAVAPALTLVVLALSILVERSLSVGSGHGIERYRELFRRTDSGLVVAPAEAIGNSLVIACAATALALVVGGLTARSVAAGRGRAGRVLDVAVMLPLGTSAVTLGFGILIAFDSPPLDWRSSRAMVVVAQALVGIPFVVRAMVPALRSIDPRLHEAAAVLGADPRRARAEVDRPVVRRAAQVAAGFAFAVSLGEFGATSFLARPDAPTVPTAMYRLLGRPGEALRGQAMALAVVLAVLTAASATVIEWRRRDGVGW
ncbi:MAG: iron ABC transporter permease [Acidimicrobiales bacterium]|nr:iron ABC transporter permease [Acidimicrobiales bacterium]